MKEAATFPVRPGWETVRLIGRGSFGAVYEIERDVFGDVEKCALKHISIPQTDGEIREMQSEGLDEQSITQSFADQARDIVTEYKMMARLNDCPNVVTCHDVDFIQKDGGYGWDIFIRMELLTPLMDILRDQLNWPEDKVVRLGKDICNALVACRQKGILHRDIKPQNIFVAKDGKYKLGDFGIARIAEKTSSATARIGTYTYMAPEVYAGEHYGQAADIYSLGMVLYWLLNDRKAPFVSVNTKSEKDAAQRRRFMGEQIPAPAHGSEGLKQIVLKACAFDPKDRYQSADEMLRDLEGIGRAPAADKAAPVFEKPKIIPAEPDGDATAGAVRRPVSEPESEENGTVGAFKTPEPRQESPEADDDSTIGAFDRAGIHTTPSGQNTGSCSPVHDKVKAGDIITFGNYIQNPDTPDRAEPIEWIVLARENNRILVLSKYALDYQPFDAKDKRAIWETCSLRTWLNDTFMNTAFNAKEQSMIPTVTLSPDGMREKSTRDRIFLLSVKEAKTFLTTKSARQCYGTAYCFACIHARMSWWSKDTFNGKCSWMLRSPGFSSRYAAFVFIDGAIDNIGSEVNGYTEVRPAMWIEL